MSYASKEILQKYIQARNRIYYRYVYISFNSQLLQISKYDLSVFMDVHLNFTIHALGRLEAPTKVLCTECQFVIENQFQVAAALHIKYTGKTYQ
jgi:hypothetical protein